MKEIKIVEEIAKKVLQENPNKVVRYLLLRDDIKWLWNNQNKELFWNFGSHASTQHYFPLSDRWRYKNNKQFDWIARVLVLL